MSDNLEFSDDAARNQDAISDTSEFVNQRRMTFDRIGLQPGERLLDLGVGTGHLARDVATWTMGRNPIVGIDVSEDMLALARTRCEEHSSIRLERADLYALPYEDHSFDVAVSVQVFEYLEDVEKACREAFRVLRPGGRLLIRDTDWGTLIWNSDDPGRMRSVLDAWDRHLVDPYLPRTLGSVMAKAGFDRPRVTGFITCESTFEPTQTSFYISRFVAPYATQHDVDQATADAWSAELPRLSAAGRYFYSLNSYVFSARKP